MGEVRSDTGRSILAVADMASAQSAGGLDEVVVTAQRREQNLQDVPISVSAMDAKALEKRFASWATQ